MLCKHHDENGASCTPRNCNTRKRGILTINEIADMLKLPSWESVDELNHEYYWEHGNAAAANEEDCCTGCHCECDESYEERQERAHQEAEQAARDELFRQWYRGVYQAVETLLQLHGLDMQARNQKQDPDLPYELRVVPGCESSWEKAANQLIETINGGNCTLYLSSWKEAANTPRQFVLGHLWNIRFYPDVYGSRSAQQIYENAFADLRKRFLGIIVTS